MIYLYSIGDSTYMKFECHVIQYANLPLVRFKQVFVSGLNGTQRDPSVVSSAHPSFKVNQENLGFLSFGDDMTGDTGRKMGIWKGLPGAVNDGMEGGPLVLFDQNGNTFVLSPMSNFMSASMQYVPDNGGHVNFGVMGGAKSVNVNYTVDFILYYSSKGINQVRCCVTKLLLV